VHLTGQNFPGHYLQSSSGSSIIKVQLDKHEGSTLIHFLLEGHLIGSYMQNLPSGQSFIGPGGHIPLHFNTILKQFSVFGSQGFFIGKHIDYSGQESGNLMHFSPLGHKWHLSSLHFSEITVQGQFMGSTDFFFLNPPSHTPSFFSVLQAHMSKSVSSFKFVFRRCL
jgi:hypothetical protein